LLLLIMGFSCMRAAFRAKARHLVRQEYVQKQRLPKL